MTREPSEFVRGFIQKQFIGGNIEREHLTLPSKSEGRKYSIDEQIRKQNNDTHDRPVTSDNHIKTHCSRSTHVI